MTSELLNPCHFTHLVAKDIQLQSLVVLTIKILKFSHNNEIHVIINCSMMCKVHVISS
jgi:hypothetical protein